MARRKFNDDAPSTNLAFGGRVPPHSIEAERAVLGGVLLENSAFDKIGPLIDPGDFYNQANATLFETMLELHKRKEPIDQITLRAALSHSGKLALVGGDEYLLSLTDTLPTVANIEAHARIVREKAVVRKIISACHEVAATGYGDYGEFKAFIEGSEKQIFEISKDRTTNDAIGLAEILKVTFAQIQENANRGRAITGLKTGFGSLDHRTNGMNPGDLIIIAGRPGMGKTAFALNVAINACTSNHHGTGFNPVVVFSLEMPKEQLANRLMSSEARVDSQRLRRGDLTTDDWRNLVPAVGKLADLPMFIDDTAAISLLEVRSKARRIQSEHGLDLIVIDYLQLMRSGGRHDSREQEISEISRSLKALAKELRIPVIALSQLNRAVESRAGKEKRPQLSDLRESGAIEQDADTIWFVYRDEVYNPDSSDRGIAEIIVGKNRAGQPGTCRVAFRPEFTRFENLEESGPPPGYD